MKQLDIADSGTEHGDSSRRDVLKTAAWATPVIAATVAAPWPGSAAPSVGDSAEGKIFIQIHNSLSVNAQNLWNGVMYSDGAFVEKPPFQVTNGLLLTSYTPPDV